MQETITLTLEQVESVLYEMGFDQQEDINNFWKNAMKETLCPGCLAGEQHAQFEKMKNRWTDIQE